MMLQAKLLLCLAQACWAATASPSARQIARSFTAAPTTTSLPLESALHERSDPPHILPLETPLPEPSHLSSQTLLPRCDNPPCDYGGGEATTLQASVVTSTIVSTTSVPCYITTYVTDSTTTTETIYSTEIITSTITEEGTVYIIKYSPTPVIKSTVYESVIQITQTMTAMWVETEGEAYEETKYGDVKTVGGGSGGGYDHGSQGGDKGGWSDAGNGGASSFPAPAPSPSASGSWGNVDAWTHATANVAVASPVAGINAAGVGAGSNGWAAASPGVTLQGQGMANANWHNAARQSLACAWPMHVLTVVSLVVGVLVAL